jgi:hypothetical protein
MTRGHGNIAILASFVIALILTIVPLPEWMTPFRPEWVALTLIYWCMALPQRIGVTIGWSMGFVLDVIKGAVFGQHALALAVVAYRPRHCCLPGPQSSSTSAGLPNVAASHQHYGFDYSLSNAGNVDQRYHRRQKQ